MTGSSGEEHSEAVDTLVSSIALDRVGFPSRSYSTSTDRTDPISVTRACSPVPRNARRAALSESALPSAQVSDSSAKRSAIAAPLSLKHKEGGSAADS